MITPERVLASAIGIAALVSAPASRSDERLASKRMRFNVPRTSRHLPLA